MKKGSLFIAIGFFACFLVFLGASSVTAQDEQEDDISISGEVVDVGSDNLTVDVGGSNVTVQVDPTAENDMDGDDALEEALEEETTQDGNDTGTDIEVGEVVELETGLGRHGLTLKRIRRPFRRDILCDGEATYADGNISCAGITARILDVEAGDPYPTQIIGKFGARVSIEDLDLSAVRVRIGYDPDAGFFAKRIVQGPVVGVRGRISDVNVEDKTISLNGLTIKFDENTAIRSFRSILVPRHMDESVLRPGLPVRAMVQYVDNEYYALGILVLNARKVRMRAIVQDLRDDGTAVIKTPGGITITVQLDGARDIAPGDFINFSGDFSNGQFKASTVGKVGASMGRSVLRRVEPPSMGRRGGIRGEGNSIIPHGRGGR